MQSADVEARSSQRLLLVSCKVPLAVVLHDSDLIFGIFNTCLPALSVLLIRAVRADSAS